MLLLGIDLGTSSIKATIFDAEKSSVVAATHFPKNEMRVQAPQTGWAEQDPDRWWEYTRQAIRYLSHLPEVDTTRIGAIGISYQMHGLVMVDKAHKVLRPSIIWCDSRAVGIGRQAFQEIGQEKCLTCLLNSPGNFTASKMKWVKENEPEIFDQAYKIMLPGDYLALQLTGELMTSYSGLSEGIMWDFVGNKPADFLLAHYGIDSSMIPEARPSFGLQGKLRESTAEDLGLPAGIPVSYRAGDQPNNAFSLGVVQPGEIAATAGTSGVVYGVTDSVSYDPKSRVNTFAHVNHKEDATCLGILLCVNGTGILNNWLKRNLSDMSYDEMNQLASEVPAGADGLIILPFGNGAERVLENNDIGAQVSNINFNIHTDAHLIRAAHEGIAYSFRYGMDIMKDLDLDAEVIRAGKANMFLSPIFREALASVANVNIELFNTDGAQGAARGAGVGAGFYANFEESMAAIERVETIEPDPELAKVYEEGYDKWLNTLEKAL